MLFARSRQSGMRRVRRHARAGEPRVRGRWSRCVGSSRRVSSSSGPPRHLVPAGVPMCRTSGRARTQSNRRTSARTTICAVIRASPADSRRSRSTAITGTRATESGEADHQHWVQRRNREMRAQRRTCIRCDHKPGSRGFRRHTQSVGRTEGDHPSPPATRQATISPVWTAIARASRAGSPRDTSMVRSAACS